MNKQLFKGTWHEIKAKLKEQWGELTDDDLDRIKANNEEIYGILEKHYGYTKDEVKKYVNEFLEKIILPNVDLIKDMSAKSWKILKDAIKENPVKSFFVACSALLLIRRLTRNSHH